MTDSRQKENDYLGQYLNPDGIEKAPEGLTEKIMSRIQVERAPAISQLNILVPVISAIITLTLVVLAVIFSNPSENTLFSGIIKYTQNMNFALPEMKMNIFSGPGLPSILIYIVIGFFVLTLFDRALSRLFHK